MKLFVRCSAEGLWRSIDAVGNVRTMDFKYAPAWWPPMIALAKADEPTVPKPLPEPVLMLMDAPPADGSARCIEARTVPEPAAEGPWPDDDDEVTEEWNHLEFY